MTPTENSHGPRLSNAAISELLCLAADEPDVAGSPEAPEASFAEEPPAASEDPFVFPAEPAAESGPSSKARFELPSSGLAEDILAREALREQASPAPETAASEALVGKSEAPLRKQRRHECRCAGRIRVA